MAQTIIEAGESEALRAWFTEMQRSAGKPGLDGSVPASLNREWWRAAKASFHYSDDGTLMYIDVTHDWMDFVRIGSSNASLYDLKLTGLPSSPRARIAEGMYVFQRYK